MLQISSLNEWIDRTDDSLEKNYKRFEVLGIYLDNLKAAGQIKDGLIPAAYHESIIKILEAEIKVRP